MVLGAALIVAFVAFVVWWGFEAWATEVLIREAGDAIDAFEACVGSCTDELVAMHLAVDLMNAQSVESWTPLAGIWAIIMLMGARWAINDYRSKLATRRADA